MQQIPDWAWTLIRYVLTAIGTVAVTKGYMSADQSTALIGALVSIVSILWGVYVRYNTRQVPADSVKPGAPVVSAATGQKFLST